MAKQQKYILFLKRFMSHIFVIWWDVLIFFTLLSIFVLIYLRKKYGKLPTVSRRWSCITQILDSSDLNENQLLFQFLFYQLLLWGYSSIYLYCSSAVEFLDVYFYCREGCCRNVDFLLMRICTLVCQSVEDQCRSPKGNWFKYLRVV